MGLYRCCVLNGALQGELCRKSDASEDLFDGEFGFNLELWIEFAAGGQYIRYVPTCGSKATDLRAVTPTL